MNFERPWSKLIVKFRDDIALYATYTRQTMTTYKWIIRVSYRDVRYTQANITLGETHLADLSASIKTRVASLPDLNLLREVSDYYGVNQRVSMYTKDVPADDVVRTI